MRREYLTGCLHRAAVLTVNEWETPLRIRDLRWTLALLIRLSDDAEGGSVNTANPTGQRGRRRNKSSEADQWQGSHRGGQCECIIHILMHILLKNGLPTTLYVDDLKEQFTQQVILSSLLMI